MTREKAKKILISELLSDRLLVTSVKFSKSGSHDRHKYNLFIVSAKDLVSGKTYPEMQVFVYEDSKINYFTNPVPNPRKNKMAKKKTTKRKVAKKKTTKRANPKRKVAKKKTAKKKTAKKKTSKRKTSKKKSSRKR